jgi:hypothetical protein
MWIRLALLSMAASVMAADGGAGTFRYNGSSYVTFGVGACQHGYANTGVAGGGDGFLWKGIALGGDIGYFRFVERGSRGFGLANVNIGYHFVNRRKPTRLDSFVSTSVLGAGFSGGGLARSGALGGGVNYWFRPRIGLRTEGRVYGFGGEALVMFRIGLSFR